MVDQNISDLFFNTDLSGAEERDAKGNFAGYNAEKLDAEADTFRECLQRLGVTAPSREALIADFYNRL